MTVATMQDNFTERTPTDSRQTQVGDALVGGTASDLVKLDLLDFTLPAELEASEPPEARGLSRDGVRLMVTSVADDSVRHTAFRCLPAFLEPGDLIVINTSGTMNAALSITRPDGTEAELHLSTHLPGDLWTVELRTADRLRPIFLAGPEIVTLPEGAAAQILAPYRSGPDARITRLWVARLTLPTDLESYLDKHGFPIRYGYVRERWPLAAYQSVYATERSSAEMPSAGRAFTPELLTALIARGIRIAPLVLHTGVASLEADERPYDEMYRVPAATAQLVNATHELGRRVIAVGTTVVRTLETVTDEQGITSIPVRAGRMSW